MRDRERHRLVPLGATLPLPFCLFEHEALLTSSCWRDRGACDRSSALAGAGTRRPLYAVGGADESATPVPGERSSTAGPLMTDADVRGERAVAKVALELLDGRPIPETITLQLTPLAVAKHVSADDPKLWGWVIFPRGFRAPSRVRRSRSGARASISVFRERSISGRRRSPQCWRTSSLRSAVLAPKLLDAGMQVIDLSGAFRLSNPALYPTWYGFDHERPALLNEAVYGLTELCNGELKKARLIANPGCYPTSILLALRPTAVRVAALASGHTAAVADPQRLFYPSLRDHAPTGTVGDPRAASANEPLPTGPSTMPPASKRLDSSAAWKNEKYANGTENA
jgi:hypothetical protein